MKKIIPILIMLSTSVAWSQGVEFEIPMFSKKVRAQGIQEVKTAENCKADGTDLNGNSSVTCGTEKGEEIPAPKLGDLGAENSQLAQDKIREHQNKTR